MAVSRAAQVGIALYAIWLIVFLLLQNSRYVDRDLVSLFGLLAIWGPLLAIAVLTAAVRVERWLRRR